MTDYEMLMRRLVDARNEVINDAVDRIVDSVNAAFDVAAAQAAELYAAQDETAAAELMARAQSSTLH